MKVSFAPSEAALKQLEEALTVINPTKLERDGTIQRFEYCYEILWKLAQRILKENEVDTDGPKNVFRALGRLSWIDNVETWIDFQRSRNETSHEYGESFAIKSYALAKEFLPIAKDLLKVLKEKSND